MQDTLDLVSALRRPRLLIRAAKAGLRTYSRDRDLVRIPGHAAGGSRQTLSRLIAQEEALNATRRAGRGGYDPQIHVAILTALLAEIRRLTKPQAAAA
ncbi:MAG: DUF6477 family protein [Pseudomonadota bacterium]